MRPGPAKTPTAQLAPGGKRDRARAKTEPKSPDGEVEIPADLSEPARVVWAAWVPLVPAGVLTTDSARAFGITCEVYVDWRRCVELVRQYGEAVLRQKTVWKKCTKCDGKGVIKANGQECDECEGVGKTCTKTPYFEYFPQAGKRLEYEHRLYQWMQQFGLTPASRPNVQVPKEPAGKGGGDKRFLKLHTG